MGRRRKIVVYRDRIVGLWPTQCYAIRFPCARRALSSQREDNYPYKQFLPKKAPAGAGAFSKTAPSIPRVVL